jgi:CMP-N-acetylneuraminic acid synthetase
MAKACTVSICGAWRRTDFGLQCNCGGVKVDKYCNVCALIPARSGSKTITDKNIRIMNGKPMIAYSILDALASNLIDKTVVSTDSEKYAKIAREYGAEVPFLRPAEISGDKTLDIEVFQHFLAWIRGAGYEPPDLLVHLRPTHPIRNVSDIDKMISIMLDNPRLDAIRSVAPAREVPYKMWLFNDDGTMRPWQSVIFRKLIMLRDRFFRRHTCKMHVLMWSELQH